MGTKAGVVSVFNTIHICSVLIEPVFKSSTCHPSVGLFLASKRLCDSGFIYHTAGQALTPNWTFLCAPLAITHPPPVCLVLLLQKFLVMP